MRYFAYGSNLNSAAFERWCAENGHPEARLVDGIAAWLPDYQPNFHYKSRLREGGALSIHARIGTCTPGALFPVGAATLAAIKAKEGVAGGYYEQLDAHALTEDGAVHSAFTFRVTEQRTRAFCQPSKPYVHMVQQGLLAFGHSPDQLIAVANNSSAAPLPNKVFVYGTLMQGQTRFDLMRAFAPERIEKAAVVGKIFEIDGYPGMVLRREPSSEALVRGQIMEFSDLAALFTELDAYEGFAGYEDPSSEYERVIATTNDGQLCWTYVYVGTTHAADLIKSGDWSARSGPV